MCESQEIWQLIDIKERFQELDGQALAASLLDGHA
jgi:hypothetical protein